MQTGDATSQEATTSGPIGRLSDELVSHILNGTDEKGEPFVRALDRFMARHVSTQWCHCVEHPSATHTARILQADQPHAKPKWARGQVVRISTAIQRYEDAPDEEAKRNVTAFWASIVPGGAVALEAILTMHFEPAHVFVAHFPKIAKRLSEQTQSRTLESGIDDWFPRDKVPLIGVATDNDLDGDDMFVRARREPPESTVPFLVVPNIYCAGGDTRAVQNGVWMNAENVPRALLTPFKCARRNLFRAACRTGRTSLARTLATVFDLQHASIFLLGLRDAAYRDRAEVVMGLLIDLAVNQEEQDKSRPVLRAAVRCAYCSAARAGAVSTLSLLCKATVGDVSSWPRSHLCAEINDCLRTRPWEFVSATALSDASAGQTPRPLWGPAFFERTGMACDAHVLMAGALTVGNTALLDWGARVHFGDALSEDAFHVVMNRVNVFGKHIRDPTMRDTALFAQGIEHLMRTANKHAGLSLDDHGRFYGRLAGMGTSMTPLQVYMAQRWPSRAFNQSGYWTDFVRHCATCGWVDGIEAVVEAAHVYASQRPQQEQAAYIERVRDCLDLATLCAGGACIVRYADAPALVCRNPAQIALFFRMALVSGRVTRTSETDALCHQLGVPAESRLSSEVWSAFCRWLGCMNVHTLNGPRSHHYGFASECRVPVADAIARLLLEARISD